nr:hypothetical protein HmN_000484100 [Hymenolepis microstoma]
MRILRHTFTTMEPEQLLTCSWFQATSARSQRKILDDPGSGHKPVIASITINSKSMTPKMPTKVKLYRVLWSKNLGELKIKREALRNTAEQTGKKEDVQAWSRQSAAQRQAILQATRATFNSFISNINYQNDSQRTFKFLGNLLNNKKKTQEGTNMLKQ